MIFKVHFISISLYFLYNSSKYHSFTIGRKIDKIRKNAIY